MPGQMPSSIYAACMGGGGSGEQLKTIIQLWLLNRGIKMEKCPVPPTKQSMATLSFYNEQGHTQVINRQNDAAKMLGATPSSLEVYCTVALVDSEHVTAGRNLSIHLIHPSHFIVEKTRPRVRKTLVQDTNQLTIRTRARVQCLLSPRALHDHSGWWGEHPENRKANRKG